MKRRLAWILSGLVFTGSIVVLALPGMAKDKAEAKAKAAAKDAEPAKAENKKKTEAKSALRLPPYYGEVITEDQREKIAAAYAKFNAKIAKLKEDIKSTTAERDQALEALLTDEQKARLAKLRDDAKAKRAKTAGK